MPRMLSIAAVAVIALVLYVGLGQLLRPPAVELPGEEQLAASGLLYRVSDRDQPQPQVVRLDRVLFDRNAVTIVFQSRATVAMLTVEPAAEQLAPRPHHRPIDQLYVGDGWQIETVWFSPAHDVSEIALNFTFADGKHVSYTLPYPQRSLRDNTALFRYVVPRHQVQAVAVGVHWIEVETAEVFPPGQMRVAADSCGLEALQSPDSVTTGSDFTSYRFEAPPLPRLVVDVDVTLRDEFPVTRVVNVRCSS